MHRFLGTTIVAMLAALGSAAPALSGDASRELRVRGGFDI